MSDNNEGVEIPAMASPEWMATGGVVGEDGYVVLRYKNGIPLVRVNGDLLSCKPGKEEATMRAWLAGWIRDGYEAGHEAGSKEANDKEPGYVECAIDSFETRHMGRSRYVTLEIPDLIAKSVFKTGPGSLRSLRVLVPDGGAAAAGDKAIAAYQRVFRWCHGECLGDVNPADPDEKAAHAAVVFLREELAVARQRVKERNVETEQVRRANERLSAKVYGQDQPDGDALRKAREEGRKEAFLKVVAWCCSHLPEGIDVSADDAEKVAEDALGQLQQAAADGDARVREEGRRLGWQEALAAVAKAHEAERKDADRAAEIADRARETAYEAEDLQQLLLMRSVATEALLSVVTAAAPKEPA